MARPWEYTKGRRIVMQVVLCGTLALSLLAAWGVDRHRAAALSWTKWQSQRVGTLYVEVPAGWRNIIDPEDGVGVQLREPANSGGVSRTLTIAQERINSRKVKTAIDLAASQLGQGAAAPEDFETFDFLGQHGVLVEVPLAVESVGMRLPYLYACVVLPSHQGVWVTMEGPHVFLPADLELFKHVLRSLREAAGEGHGVAAR